MVSLQTADEYIDTEGTDDNGFGFGGDNDDSDVEQEDAYLAPVPASVNYCVTCAYVRACVRACVLAMCA